MKLIISLILLSLIVGSFLLLFRSNKPKVIVMLGAPGSGKGTQSILLSEKFSIPQISTGDLFRDHLKRDSALGKKVKGYMDGGQLVPDELVLDMLFERISQADCKKGFILDGFPRTVAQAKALDSHLKSADIRVMSLEVPDEVIVQRLTKRVVCTQCGAPYHLEALPPKRAGICDKCGGSVVVRNDDREEVVRKRLEVFHEQTEAVKYYYEEKGLLTLIAATSGKEETFNAIVKSV